MNYHVVFTHESRQDIKETENWYEEYLQRLGKRFTNAFISSINKTQENPALYPNYHQDVKRCIIRKFPYSIYYYVDKEK